MAHHGGGGGGGNQPWESRAPLLSSVLTVLVGLWIVLVFPWRHPRAFVAALSGALILGVFLWPLPPLSLFAWLAYVPVAVWMRRWFLPADQQKRRDACAKLNRTQNHVRRAEFKRQHPGRGLTRTLWVTQADLDNEQRGYVNPLLTPRPARPTPPAGTGWWPF